MFFTPVSARVARTIVACGGRVLRVISAWFGARISRISCEYLRTAMETREPFHPGPHCQGPHLIMILMIAGTLERKP